jgi:hypothetical protein
MPFCPTQEHKGESFFGPLFEFWRPRKAHQIVLVPVLESLERSDGVSEYCAYPFRANAIRGCLGISF